MDNDKVSADPSGQAGTFASASEKNAERSGHHCSSSEWKDLTEKEKHRIRVDGEKRRQKTRQQRKRKEKGDKEYVAWREDAESRVSLLVAHPKRKAKVSTEDHVDSDDL